MAERVSTADLRNFGLLVGGIFAAIALWPVVVRGGDLRLWAMIAAAVLIVPAVVWPRALGPIQAGWMRLGHVLGWINTRILLSVIFFLMVTPMAVVMRLFGRDPLRRRFDSTSESYRIRTEPRPTSHVKRSY